MFIPYSQFSSFDLYL
jgi:hypothetical protein